MKYRNLSVTVVAITIFIGSVLYFGRFDGNGALPSGMDESLTQRSGAMEALEFWSASRAYPQNDIPRDTYLKEFTKSALAQKNEQAQKNGQARKNGLKGADAITQWHSIGPNNLSGRCLAISVSPQNHNTIYVGSASGGLWRSHSGGVNADWERVQTGYPVLGVSAVALDPTDSNTIYIGTGEVYRYSVALGGLVVRTTRGSFGMGILKSTNYGATWTKSLDWSTEQQRGVQALKLNPLNHRTIYAGTTEGFYKSTDAGVTWDFLLQLPMAEDFLVNPLDTNMIVLSTGNFRYGAGVHKTTDGGVTWEDIFSLPEFSGKTLLEMYEANPNIIYADVADSTSGDGSLWESIDFGDTWFVINPNPGIYGVQGWYSHFIAAHPTDSSQLFHASVGWQKSTDGGVSFHGAGSGTYSDHHSFAHDPTDPDILYVVNDDGPYRSTDFGETFAYIGNNLPTGQFYNGFSNSATDSLLALGQVQDHIPGYIYHGSTNWGRSANDEVGWTAIDPTNDNIMYVINRNGGAVLKSTNRGVSWSTKANLGTFGAWNSPLVLSPSQPATLYAAKTRIYKTTNAGTTFTATNGNLDIDGNPAISMAVSATNPDTVLVGFAPFVTRAEVFRTINGGLSWQNVTSVLPDRYPLDLVFDPNDSHIAYATFGGFGSGHVYKSIFGGASWFDISGTLPDVPTGAVFVDPTNSNTVYVGNDIGVYVSTDAGGSWSSFSEGLPEAVLVSDLSYTPSNRTLRVTTHGNGVFERKLDNTLPALSLLSPNGGESIEAGAPYAITWGSGLVGLLLVEYSTDNGSSWHTVGQHVPAASGSINWTPPFTPTATALVRVTAEDAGSISDASDATFTIFFDGVIRAMNNGWNLVSTSGTPSDLHADAVYPARYGRMFDYTPLGYRARDILEPERGYWAKFIGAQTVGVKGTPVTTLTDSVDAGWNLFGAISTAVAVGQITTDPPGILSPHFFTHDGSRYVEASSILPGYAYWVHASAPGTMTISSSSASPKQDVYVHHELPENRITFSDKSGNSQTLSFGSANSLVSETDGIIPPVPPAESFDVRFSSNRSTESVTGTAPQTFHILSQGISYPLTIFWEINEAALSAKLSSATFGERSLSRSGSLTILREGENEFTLSVSSAQLPTAFRLEQNYPNPFNPSTEIAYAVPERSEVTLTISNVLGEEIATLVNDVQDAGTYSVRWDASSMPSGVYLYRLTAGSFSQSKKVVLAK